jgi:PhzF family phenazine biosynthesis protein
MNLAETAFLLRATDGYDLRWFTPGGEVDLCGHATLASAHVLWQDGHLAPSRQARFHTRSGLLTAERHDTEIVLDFPATPPTAAAAPADLLQGLGPVRTRWIGQSPFDLVVELEDEPTVRAFQPDLVTLARLKQRGVIVTAAAVPGSRFDFVSRFFAPGLGIPEDPVTGSAHCALGPYWRERLGRDRFLAYQASERGGILSVTCVGERVLLGGMAVTVSRLTLL